MDHRAKCIGMQRFLSAVAEAFKRDGEADLADLLHMLAGAAGEGKERELRAHCKPWVEARLAELEPRLGRD